MSGLFDELAARWAAERRERGEPEPKLESVELDPAEAATALKDLHADGEYEDQLRWRP